MNSSTYWRVGLALMASGALAGCALFAADQKPKIPTPAEKVFKGSLEEVWRATMLALQSPKAYPLRVSNIDTGTIETEPIKGVSAFKPPFDQSPPSSGFSYRLAVQVIKGDVSGQEAYRVSVSKFPQIERDFISHPEALESDGFEELGIIYRIGRELAIDKGLQRAQNRKAKSKTKSTD